MNRIANDEGPVSNAPTSIATTTSSKISIVTKPDDTNSCDSDSDSDNEKSNNGTYHIKILCSSFFIQFQPVFCSQSDSVHR